MAVLRRPSVESEHQHLDIDFFLDEQEPLREQEVRVVEAGGAILLMRRRS